MSGMAIAGPLASTRALFGFIQVFPQSSIRYGPRCFCDSPSVLPDDIRSVSAAPVTVSETARRTLTSLVADMARLLCFGTLRNAALSCHVPEAHKPVGSRDEHFRSGAVCRLPRRENRERNINRPRPPSEVSSLHKVTSDAITFFPVNTTIDISHRRSPLERLRRCFVGRKETLESKLREGHVDRRAEHRRRAEEAQFSGVGDELEGDEHA